MSKHGFNATSLKMGMLVLLTLLIFLAAGGFYYCQDWLTNYAGEVNAAHQAAESPVPTASLTPIQSSASAKIAKMTYKNSTFKAESDRDLNLYARGSGLTISSISTTNQPTGLNVAPIAGAEAKYLRVTIDTPVNYAALVKFMKGIETNLPIMRVTGVKISPDQEAGKSVNIDPLIIQVYARQ